MTLLAKCPQCDASWRVRGVEPGERLTCPFCAHAFGFAPVPGATVTIPREDLQKMAGGEDTLTAAGNEENLLGALTLPDHLRISLEIMNGTQKGSVVVIAKSRVTIGRGAGDLALNDSQISRKHAVIEIYGDRYILLRDLASTNGTYVNNMLISQTKVEHGDLLRFGYTETRLKIEKR